MNVIKPISTRSFGAPFLPFLPNSVSATELTALLAAFNLVVVPAL